MYLSKSPRSMMWASGLALAAGMLTSGAAAQSIWQPQNIWAVPAPEATFIFAPMADIDSNWQRRPTGFAVAPTPPTQGRSGYALVVNNTGFARQNLDAVNDRITTALGQYTHNFSLNSVAGARADVVVPVLADGNLIWSGPLINLSRFKVQVDVQLLRQDDRPNPMAPLPGTYTAVGGVTTLDTGWFNQPLLTREASLAQSWMQRYANMPTGERGYRVQTTIRTIAEADTLGIRGDLNSRIDFNLNSVDHTTSRGVTISVGAEPANYSNANSRDVISASWARQRFNVTGQGVNVGIIEPGKASVHSSYGARLARANNGAAGNNNFDSEHTTAVASIIGSSGGNGAQNGVAPGANLITADTSEWGGTVGAINEVIGRFGAGNAGIINFSMSGGIANGEGLDSIISANPNVTFVWASGNQRVNPNPVFNYVGTVPNPAYAYNNIAVGALDFTFKKMADFSSDTQGNYPTKPDVVAPGGFVLGASNRDLNNNGVLDDYTRTFIANHWSKTLNPNTPRYPEVGGVSGTSFAAPHVSGILALAHEYANDQPMKYDARSKDHRVMKALLIAGAQTRGIVDANDAGWAQLKSGNLRPTNPTRVTRSLDTTLGGGMADAMGMLGIYSNAEARVADNNNQRNFQIDLRPTIFERTGFWDLETVGAMQGARPGTVDYLLGGGLLLSDFNTPQGVTSNIGYLRVALTWDRMVTAGAYDDLSNLELLLFIDGFTPMNITGWDPAFGEADAVDYKIAFTENLDENVKLFDFEIPSFFLFGTDLPLGPDAEVTLLSTANMYLQVRNFSMVNVEYGIAASFIRVPTPAGTTLLVLVGLSAMRRRR